MPRFARRKGRGMSKESPQRRFQRKMREQGRCAICGAPSDRYRCPSCAAKHREKMNARYQRIAKRGMKSEPKEPTL